MMNNKVFKGQYCVEIAHKRIIQITIACTKGERKLDTQVLILLIMESRSFNVNWNIYR